MVGRVRIEVPYEPGVVRVADVWDCGPEGVTFQVGSRSWRMGAERFHDLVGKGARAEAAESADRGGGDA